jgi:small subunit ribosomal protein S15
MSLSTAEKVTLIEKYGQSKQDSGSVEVQVALLTTDISKLTEHFKTHPKDFHSRKGLIRKVNLRRSLLQYLRRSYPQRYTDIVAKLELRG